MKTFLSLLAVGLALQAVHVFAKGLKCSSHPLYKPGFVGELPRGWEYSEDVPKRLHWAYSAYLPRYSQHTWAPINNPKSNKYRNLDYFITGYGRTTTATYCTLYFQRKAKAHLFIYAHPRGFLSATLPGWEYEGWVEMVEGDSRNKTILGITRKSETIAPKFILVLSKAAADHIVLPHFRWVGANLRGPKARGFYHVMISEADGSAVKKPASPNGVSVSAGGRCPAALHSAWKAKGPDPADHLTRDKTYATWHPIMDPCFWCGYDHEHGSGSKELMGYTPRYGYVAEKNKKEDESHNGFKGIVFQSGNYNFYYGFHAQLSSGRRFVTRFHTVVFAITDKKTNELVAEISFKADFGFVATGLQPSGLYPLTEAGREMFEDIMKKRAPRKFRFVNVIDPGNLDRRFKYRSPESLLRGRYEQWKTTPICAGYGPGRFREPVFDVRDPNTALRTSRSNQNDMTKLGHTRHGKFLQQAGVDRQLRVENLTFSDELCRFSLPNIVGGQQNGTFYTDPYGKILLNGPGPGAVAQYIKPGFKHTISGKFEVYEPWIGMHQEFVHGSFKNIMYSVDPKLN